MEEDIDILDDVLPEHHFRARDGTTIKNLEELREAFERMDNETYSHHVNNEKNDFSEWVRVIIKDEKLAKDIFLATSKEDTANIIGKALKKALKKRAEASTEKIDWNTGEDFEKQDSYVKDFFNLRPAYSEEKNEINSDKIDEILRREKEIQKKEQKIEEIEEKIEKKLETIKNPKNREFFSKEFVQGIIVGVLLVVLSFLVYIKFFAA